MTTDNNPEPRAHIGEVAVYCAFDELLNIENVFPNPLNPNKHPQEQIELLAKIILKQGWRRPITISRLSGTVVVGEGRLLAAMHLKLLEVPVEYQNYNSKDDELADLVADNKLAAMSDFDEKIITELLSEIDISVLELTGFNEQELSDFLDMCDKNNQQLTENNEVRIDEYRKDQFDHVCPRCNFAFNG